MQKRRLSFGCFEFPGHFPVPVNSVRRALEFPSGSASSWGKRHEGVAVRYEAVRSLSHPGAILFGERKRNSLRDVVFFRWFPWVPWFFRSALLKVFDRLHSAAFFLAVDDGREMHGISQSHLGFCHV